MTSFSFSGELCLFGKMSLDQGMECPGCAFKGLRDALAGIRNIHLNIGSVWKLLKLEESSVGAQNSSISGRSPMPPTAPLGGSIAQ